MGSIFENPRYSLDKQEKQKSESEKHKKPYSKVKAAILAGVISVSLIEEQSGNADTVTLWPGQEILFLDNECPPQVMKTIDDPSMRKILERAQEGFEGNFMEKLSEDFRALSIESRLEYSFVLAKSQEKICLGAISKGLSSSAIILDIPGQKEFSDAIEANEFHKLHVHPIENFLSLGIAPGKIDYLVGYYPLELIKQQINAMRDGTLTPPNNPPSINDFERVADIDEYFEINKKNGKDIPHIYYHLIDPRGVWSYGIDYHGESDLKIRKKTRKELFEKKFLLDNKLYYDQIKDKIEKPYDPKTIQFLNIGNNQPLVQEFKTREKLKQDAISAAKKLGFTLTYKPYPPKPLKKK